MEEGSPLYSTLIDLMAIVAAVVMMAVAAFIDIKTLTIPNRVTFPAMAFGLCMGAARCITGYPAIEFAITLAISWTFVYGLWAMGLWGGGDAKAVLTLSILLSPMYPPLSFVVVFLLLMAVSIFIRESATSMIKALWERNALYAALAISPAAAAALMLTISSGAGLIVASLLSLLTLAVIGDLASAILPGHERACLGPSSEISLAGRRPAEDVYMTEKGPARRMRPAGMIESLLAMTKKDKRLPLIPRRRSGLLPEDIRLLKQHVSFINIVPQRPMGPLLFISLIASLASLYAISLPEVSALL